MDNSEYIKKIIQSASFLLGGNFKPTNRGVPRIILKTKKTTYSIVYSYKFLNWKIFYPYPEIPEKQTKLYFENIFKLMEYLNVTNKVA